MKINPLTLQSAFFVSLFLLAPGMAGPGAHAPTYSVLHSFRDLTGVTGFTPVAPLIQGPDGTLYGTASEGEGGFNHYGTVFTLQPDGSGFTVLKHFTYYAEAGWPRGGLVFAGSTLYGTTVYGGHLDAGVVFSIALRTSLRIEMTATNRVVLAWPYPSEGFVLEQNPNLTAATWTSENNPPVRVGEEWRVIQSPAAGTRFYRLHKP